MNANRFGEIFQWTSFGESHGEAMGVVIDGCPAGVTFDHQLLHDHLQRRRPGQHLTSPREEKDQPQILSGIFEGKTLGTPISIVIENQDARPKDYDQIKKDPRIGHADDIWEGKYSHVDYRGGGRASARETVARVIAGAVAQMFCQQSSPELKVCGVVQSIGELEVNAKSLSEFGQDVRDLLSRAQETQESYGGIIELQMNGVPKYLGQPVFHKLKNDLSSAFMSIGACCGVEFGGGFALSRIKGSELHKEMENKNYGGLRGGISTGEPIIFRLAFKPTSSIKKTAKEGRHDPCIVPRAVPVVEAMAWAVLADHILWRRLDNL